MHAKKNKTHFSGGIDKKLLFLTLGLTFIGLIAVLDASAPLAIRTFSDKFYYFKEQLVGAVVGITMLMVFSKIDYKFWEKNATIIFFASITLLLLVFIPGIGVKVMGARRWINLGFINFQPSELVKFGLAIYLAKVFSKDKKILAYLTPIGIACLLIMLQPDLGTTLIVGGLAMAQIFASGLNMLKIFGITGAGLLLVTLLILVSDYRRERLMTFLKISQNPLAEGYHIKQILIALGSGGFLGVGLGQSRQKYLFLPETATDSIFAVIAEEIGFIGAGLLLMLFLLYVARGITIAKNAPDKFSYLLAVGITSWVGVQVFLNIASMVALVPLTGIPLPFISFGSTSLVMLLAATGILLNISKYDRR